MPPEQQPIQPTIAPKIMWILIATILLLIGVIIYITSKEKIVQKIDAPKEDLAIKSVTILPQPIVAGDYKTVEIVISNLSSQEVADTYYEFHLESSLGYTTGLFTSGHFGLLPNEEKTMLFDDSFPDVGTFTAVTKVDPSNIIKEKDETNNELRQSIQIEPNTLAQCTDSDNGLDYYVKGTMHSTRNDVNPPVIQNLTDVCEGNMVKDYNCPTYITAPDQYYGIATFICPNGCKNGACIK